jgi:glycogen(starch) synthase
VQLVKASSWFLYSLDEWKTDLWNLAGIPTPKDDHETNETIVFGYLVAWFLGEVSEQWRRGMIKLT